MHLPVPGVSQRIKQQRESAYVVYEYRHGCPDHRLHRHLYHPYSTWVALIFLTCVVTCYGYPVFLQGHWAIDTFFTFYLLVLLAPFLFFGWKLLKRTKSVNPLEADLVWQKPVIDAYEEAFDEPLSDFGKRLAICCNRYNRWVELENRHKIIRTSIE
ncbi:hypothetical protein HBH61_187180 [Parastagonospora nodorum]|nr:hypothetical protein HBH46_070940 [Parastagonospora nodorum]KAH4802642.1 hypothetical protein HBH61_187180 [Parastagonospora nodorum]KAH5216984.1 hypothetical protein HBH68_057680 [Parastagonospora nodorum]